MQGALMRIRTDSRFHPRCSRYIAEPMTVITDSEALASFCARQKGASFVAVDTEFMRERTYWPILCLVQVAGGDEAVAIDALAPGISLAPLLALMADPSLLKVFHAARQDLEIFYQLSGEVPHPVFDTQVAAMVCGFGDAASYETLVKRLAGASLDKASRFTDWAHRPLSERQISYALADVVHLRTVYERLEQRLAKNGRAVLDAVAQGLADPDPPPAIPAKAQAPPGIGPLIELLRVLLKQRCEDFEVAQKLVASADDLEAIAAADDAPVRALHGWRREVFGDDALALKHGRLALTAGKSRIQLVPVPERG